MRLDPRSVPRKPGVYQFYDGDGKVLYIGKSRNLRDRLSAYMDGSDDRFQIPHMMKRAVRLDFTVTATEREALILENNMIRHHKPPYNILLKDDKHFPYLKITRDKFPRIVMVRRVSNDGCGYFGPFTAGPIRKTQRTVRRLFRLRPCTRMLPRGCIYGDINVCMAPCRGDCTPEEYSQSVQQAEMFLRGEHRELERKLRKRMKDLSDDLRFEDAAQIRDQLAAISRLAAQQRVDFLDDRDRDALGVKRIGRTRAVVVHFSIRNGQIISRRNFTLDIQPDSKPGEIISAFLSQHYGTGTPPKEVLITQRTDDGEVLEEWLGSVRGSRVKLIVPTRGPKKKLMEMVEQNLRHVVSQMEGESGSENIYSEAALELMEWLGLERPPKTIEGFDISTIQGRHSVGSKVSFENGKPRKGAYRRFKIRSVEGQDDFAMMEEVISRRITHRDDDPVPDLMLIDGGKGQLGSASHAVQRSGIPLRMVALAKKDEEFFLPGKPDPVPMPAGPARDLLINVRDEAHRFALLYHRKIRGKAQTVSELDRIPGIGKETRIRLLSHFGSVKRIWLASEGELCQVEGIGPKRARDIKKYLGSTS